MPKTKCKYWDKCFQKNNAHVTAFLHPSDVTDDDDDGKAGTSKLNLNGKNVMFIGTLLGCNAKSAENRAKNHGCNPVKIVSKPTDILIVGEDAPDADVDKAKKNGVKIMSQSEWEKTLREAEKAERSRPARNKSSVDYNEDSSDEEKVENVKTKRRVVKVNSDVTAIGGTEDPAGAKTSAKAGAAGATASASTSRKRGAAAHAISDSDTSDTEEDDDDKPSPSKKSKVDEEEEKRQEAKKSPEKKKRRVKCKYAAKCFRKNKEHRKEFCHPGDSDEADAVERMEVDDDEPNTDLPTPKNKMADGESVTIEGKHQDYTIKRTGDTYYCTCYQWKMQTRAINKRSCKHLKGHLGDAFEDARCGEEIVPGSETITRGPRHKAFAQVMLAQKWDPAKVNPTGWWISEKLDGVRAFWDGKAFYSRLGNEFIPPSWFIKGMPSDMTLDGELFGGRGKFQSTVSIVKTPGSGKWKDIKFYIFDAPSLKNVVFEQRVATLADYFKKNSAPYVHPLEHEKCTGVDHLKAEQKKVEAKGGEGLMIRQPKSLYEHRRSDTLLKIKTFHDAEALVIGHEKGKGRNAFVCGAIVCQMECGKKFKVGSGLSDKDRRSPPKKGSIITYRFQEYTNDGIPRFPSYVGIRIDADGPKDVVLPKKPE